MRSILVDWLIEVQWKLKLLPETLYLSINITDRILSLRRVSLSRLQLVGLAATLLASKYEEVVPPSIQNFVFLADNCYTAAELLTVNVTFSKSWIIPWLTRARWVSFVVFLKLKHMILDHVHLRNIWWKLLYLILISFQFLLQCWQLSEFTLPVWCSVAVNGPEI